MYAGRHQVDNLRCRTFVSFGGKHLAGDLPRGHGRIGFPEEIERHPVAVGLWLWVCSGARRLDIADGVFWIEQQEGRLDVFKIELGGPQLKAQSRHVGEEFGIFGCDGGNPGIRHASEFTET